VTCSGISIDPQTVLALASFEIWCVRVDTSYLKFGTELEELEEQSGEAGLTLPASGP
jgi:hypothetical protein